MNIEERRVNVEPTEELEAVSLDKEHLDRITWMGTQAGHLIWNQLILFLKNNLNILAWSHEDMPGIDPKIMVH